MVQLIFAHLALPSLPTVRGIIVGTPGAVSAQNGAAGYMALAGAVYDLIVAFGGIIARNGARRAPGPVLPGPAESPNTVTSIIAP
jgi:hypothetical protein